MQVIFGIEWFQFEKSELGKGLQSAVWAVSCTVHQSGASDRGLSMSLNVSSIVSAALINLDSFD